MEILEHRLCNTDFAHQVIISLVSPTQEIFGRPESEETKLVQESPKGFTANSCDEDTQTLVPREDNCLNLYSDNAGKWFYVGNKHHNKEIFLNPLKIFHT